MGTEAHVKAADEQGKRVSGVYRRQLSSTLEARAELVRVWAKQVAAGALSPRLMAERLEMLARALDENVGEALVLEAKCHG